MWKCTQEESAPWSLWSVVLGGDTTCRQPCSFFDFYCSKADTCAGHRGWRVGVVVFLGKNKVGASEIIAKF